MTQREPALRKPRTELEKAIVEHLEIKNPLVEATNEGISFISGNCFYCEDAWVHELEVATVDSKTGKVTGTVEIYVCEGCRSTKLTKIPKERIRVIRVRPVK